MRTITVAAAILRKKGRILIARRASHVAHGGMWELPGGKIESGESPEQGLRREIYEELGVSVEVGGLAAEATHRYDEFRIHLL